MSREELFEALSHPIRINILKKLSQNPMSFSELKRTLNIESSGKLDFHLKKLEGLVILNEEGKYILTKDGYAALQAIDTALSYGWQKRAFYLNIIACLLINTFFALTNIVLWFYIVLPLTIVWLAFYTYWTVRKRHAIEW